jgi:hypothetical protein
LKMRTTTAPPRGVLTRKGTTRARDGPMPGDPRAGRVPGT